MNIGFDKVGTAYRNGYESGDFAQQPPNFIMFTFLEVFGERAMPIQHRSIWIEQEPLLQGELKTKNTTFTGTIWGV